MKKFHYIKYQEKYKFYLSLFKQDKDSQKYVWFPEKYSYLIFSENHFIGLACLIPMNETRLEIRRWILPKYRNQGIGTEIAKDFAEFAFETFPEYPELILNINYKNEAAINSAKKAGFVFHYDLYEQRQELGEGHYYRPYTKKRV